MSDWLVGPLRTCGGMTFTFLDPRSGGKLVTIKVS